jgi:hypothetical protein
MEAMPQTLYWVRTDTRFWNRLDGFSTIAPLLFYLEDMSAVGTIDHEHIEHYTYHDVKTVCDFYQHFAYLV